MSPEIEIQPVQPEETSGIATPEPDATPPQKSKFSDRLRSKKLTVILIIAIILLGASLVWALKRPSKQQNNSNSATNTSPQNSQAAASTIAGTAQGLQLNPNKDYGNKYSDGILPVGDGKYTTDSAKRGYVYACSQYAQNLEATAGGAGKRGPWFVNGNTEYDINKKINVRGSVHWQGSLSDKVSGSTRTISTNDLPSSHSTGIYPIAASDPAYTYDANPNSIMSQSLDYALDANPSYGAPSCMSGEAGVMLSGVAIFNGLDAGGRDAGAWEVQDGCQGHPQSTGEYHYHTLSSCIKGTSVKDVIGFALDGFPITGPRVGNNNFLTTSDLDACHGIVSEITLDGKKVTMYHYVMTQDFPYSVSCFRGTAITPPGQHEGGPNRAGSGMPPPKM